nr:GspH/FimT family pseudopilin [Halomonas campaniensis]
MIAGRRHEAQGGFTLIELLVTIAVLAVILTIAVPNFKSFVERGHLSSSHNSLLSGLNVARSEAVKRREVVRVEVTPEESGGGWLLEVKRLQASGLTTIDCADPSQNMWCVKIVDERSSPVVLSEAKIINYNQLGRPSQAEVIELAYAGDNRALCINMAGVASSGDCEVISNE